MGGHNTFWWKSQGFDISLSLSSGIVSWRSFGWLFGFMHTVWFSYRGRLVVAGAFAAIWIDTPARMTRHYTT